MAIGLIIFTIIALIMATGIMGLGIMLLTPGTRDMLPPQWSVPMILGMSTVIAVSGYFLVPRESAQVMPTGN